MNFLDFVGNENAVNLLSSLMDGGRFPHALLIEGDAGLGKKTLARALSRALVCRGDEKPCGVCAQCRKAAEKIHPDIKEYIPSGTANSFHVDTVREIINDAYIQPNEADYKIYILADVHCMNVSAQNAILKILEEPPQYAVFILTARSKSELLPTVISRCVTVSLEGVNPQKGAQYIVSHRDDIDYDTALKAVSTFNGNIGRALTGISDDKTAELVTVCSNICLALCERNEYKLVTVCSAFQKDRQGIVFACELLKNIFRDALVYKSGAGLTSGQEESAKLLNSRLKRKSIVKLSKVCDEIKKMALMNANNALLITEFCCEMKNALGSR